MPLALPLRHVADVRGAAAVVLVRHDGAALWREGPSRERLVVHAQARIEATGGASRPVVRVLQQFAAHAEQVQARVQSRALPLEPFEFRVQLRRIVLARVEARRVLPHKGAPARAGWRLSGRLVSVHPHDDAAACVFRRARYVVGILRDVHHVHPRANLGEATGVGTVAGHGQAGGAAARAMAARHLEGRALRRARSARRTHKRVDELDVVLGYAHTRRVEPFVTHVARHHEAVVIVRLAAHAVQLDVLRCRRRRR